MANLKVPPLDPTKTKIKFLFQEFITACNSIKEPDPNLRSDVRLKMKRQSVFNAQESFTKKLGTLIEQVKKELAEAKDEIINAMYPAAASDKASYDRQLNNVLTLLGSNRNKKQILFFLQAAKQTKQYDSIFLLNEYLTRSNQPPEVIIETAKAIDQIKGEMGILQQEKEINALESYFSNLEELFRLMHSSTIDMLFPEMKFGNFASKVLDILAESSNEFYELIRFNTYPSAFKAHPNLNRTLLHLLSVETE